MQQGFTNLRTHSDSENGHESFWPSFTDIMMVVVMIFMITSVVVVMRNWELVQELRNTMESERLAEEMVRSANETNETLEERLAQAQYQLSELRMALMQAKEIDEEKSNQLSDREKQLLIIQLSLKQQQDENENSQRAIVLLNEEVAAQNATITSNENRIISLNNERDELLKTVEEQKSKTLMLQGQIDKADGLFQSLQGNFDELKVKYDKLIKPARSAKGKYVVDVRYEKNAKGEKISFRDQGEKEYSYLDRSELDFRLAELKKKYPKKLYLKIIIPEDSGLTYNEAWGFMKKFLEKYDYYYQK
ncbi:MAG: hypothetical protein OEY66_08585 [Gammaproteobacteria bacterium]|nr:hypothetical protein [Gammaproteobacteria bacterium]